MALATAVDPTHAIADAVLVALGWGIAVLMVIATVRWEPLDIPWATPAPGQNGDYLCKRAMGCWM